MFKLSRGGEKLRRIEHYLSQMWPLEHTACLRSVKGRISLHKLQCSGKVCLFIFFRMCPISTCNTQEALGDTAQGGNTSLISVTHNVLNPKKSKCKKYSKHPFILVLFS